MGVGVVWQRGMTANGCGLFGLHDACRDQRISQDVDRFCDEVSQALPKLMLQPFLVAYYSYRTFVR